MPAFLLERKWPKSLSNYKRGLNRAAARLPIASISPLEHRTSTRLVAPSAMPSVCTTSPISPKESGIERPSIYRAFVRGPKHPNFKTVLSVLDAMGFQLQVSVRRDARARPARSKAASSSRTSKG